jgi:hypothetical protein
MSDVRFRLVILALLTGGILNACTLIKIQGGADPPKPPPRKSLVEVKMTEG